MNDRRITRDTRTSGLCQRDLSEKPSSGLSPREGPLFGCPPSLSGRSRHGTVMPMADALTDEILVTVHELLSL